MPRWLPRLLACLVVACVAGLLLVEQSAFATILPACEVEPLVTMIPAVPEPTCEVVTTVDDETGETSAAPICDPSGASAVAPLRIYPVSDALIRAAPGCDHDALEQAVNPGSQDRSAHPADAFLDPTLAFGDKPVPRVECSRAPAPSPVEDAARPGFLRGVYHPPR